jgi:ferredoxin
MKTHENVKAGTDSGSANTESTMAAVDPETTSQYLINADGLTLVLENLKAREYTLIGPKIEDNAIVYDQIESLEDFPKGWTDEQGPGSYHVQKTDDQRLFNYTVGPHSWKKYLHPPHLRLWQAERQGSRFQVLPENNTEKAFAFIGVRPCELKAMEIQDRIFRGETFTDTHYDHTRTQAFILAINCGRANDTCFCTSMDSGPQAKDGYDLALTEFFEDGRHLFLIEIGSEKGGDALEAVPVEQVEKNHLAICNEQYEDTCASISRTMDTQNLRESLLSNPDHPRWEAVADRCLSCANCTLVCPTCFCTTVEDTTDLSGDHAERWRRWDSCFTMDFSYVAGGNIRSSTKSRYRQWMTHKLATWHDQFDTTGCVGCGRCITWCPVGIDITEEVESIQKSPVTR